MKINIFTVLNGVGLQKDFELVRDILLPLGHEVFVSDYAKHEGCREADIAFHMEVPRFELIKRNKKNVFIPNAEWFYPKWKRQIHKFDNIFCKTKDCLNIFRRLHNGCIYTGFISDDKKLNVVKQPVFIHVAGQSKTKGTQAIVNAYKKKPDLPLCWLVSSSFWECGGNLKCAPRMPEKDLNKMLNACLFHLCPSEYEGWGHYIHEGLSTESVVLTTGAAPMDEFVTDQRCLIRLDHTAPIRQAQGKYVNSESVIETILSVANLSDTELKEIGTKNRQKFLSNNQFFKDTLIKYINENN